MPLTPKQKTLLKSSSPVKKTAAQKLMDRPVGLISVPRGTGEKLRAAVVGPNLVISLGCSSVTIPLAGLVSCVTVNNCVNAELALPGAGALTNFAAAVIAAYEAHIAAGGADPEFEAEVLAVLQAANPAITTAFLNILNTALATSPNPLLSNLCAYINDCIDAGLLVVSADAGNAITTGTDGGAFLNAAALVNIYNADGTLTGNRTVTQGALSLLFQNTVGVFTTSIQNATGNSSMGVNNTTTGETSTVQALLNRAHIQVDDGAGQQNEVDVTLNEIEFNFINNSDFKLDGDAGLAGEVFTSNGPNLPPTREPPVATRYINTQAYAVNTPITHTHALADGTNIIVQVRDATGEIVYPIITITSATTFDVEYSIAGPLSVVAM